jgi:hypothetical protein
LRHASAEAHSVSLDGSRSTAESLTAAVHHNLLKFHQHRIATSTARQAANAQTVTKPLQLFRGTLEGRGLFPTATDG